MKKKWLAVVPALALVAAPLPFQSADAASQDEYVQIAESEIPEGYEAILEWPAEEQPLVQQGSQSFEAEFIQVMLVHFGHDTDVDGVFGPHTHEQVKSLQAEKGLTQDGIVGVQTWTVLLDEYVAQSFTAEDAVTIAEKALDNDDLVFSSNGEKHWDSEGNAFYNLRAQSQELIDGGGTGTVGHYDVFQNGDVVEADPK
ncbi:peptidoglycan-binding domain-containing protein [Alkalicoccobacillus porphyridii]|uniref:Peptidoglycan-binding protein n=1 Tax=Alkalicoccobacillus porphyridii TaxID=2597270 RepID=A0A554A4A8_9BACI|nr:peptidoglycan-binding domain-containing protein [Alkalicoccobacillus porphyridii]TSB48530.1 peptidoglycan-binding protein [Alkalicoccobacillus porphyridii]